MKSYIIHLVRHGMTSANIEGRYAGTTDIPLCDKGIEQLNELKKKYDYESPEEIYCSPLIRCKQTAEILYGKDVNFHTVPELHEYAMGEFEGKTTKDLIDNQDYKDWVRGIKGAPGGESNDKFGKRVCTAFVQTVRDILKSGKTTAAIVAHGGVIMTLLSVYGIPQQQEPLRWMANNGRGFTIRVTPSIWMRTGMVEVLSEYPFGSADEPDLSVNPVKNSAKESGVQIDFTAKGNNNSAQTDDYDDFSDFDDDGTGVIWADVDDNEKENNSH